MLIVCPCCNGAGTIAEHAPVRLSAMQYRIWDIVRRSKHGITCGDLVDKVYENCKSPEHAQQSVCVTVWKANKRLAEVKQKIVSTRGRGSIYTLQRLDDQP